MIAPLIATSAQASAAAAPTINLTFDWWGNTTRDQLTVKAIAGFEKLHPNIKITPEFDGSFSDYFQKLTTMVAGGNAPDIMQMDYDYINAFAQRGALANMATMGINTKNISKGVLDSGILNGKMWGIPNSLNAYALIYNPALLKKAGIHATMSTHWTWAQFTNVLKTIHSKLGIYGMDDPEDAEHFDYWARQYGQSMYNKTQNAVGYTLPTLTSFFNYFTQLRNSHVIPNGEVMLANPMHASNDLFNTGKSAMVWYWVNGLESYRSMTTEPLALMLPPYQPGKKDGMYIKPSQYWSISSQTKYPKQAAEFVNYLLNNLQANEDMGTDRGIPVSSVIQKEMEPHLTGVERQEVKYMQLAMKVATIPMDPAPPEANDQVLNDWTNVISAVTYNKQTPLAAAKQLIQETNQLAGQ